MAITKSSGLVQALAEAFAGFEGGSLSVYTGNPPQSSNGSPTGYLLYSIPVPHIDVGVAGTIEKPVGDTWAAVALADGVAGWFRLSAGDPTINSDTMLRVDGTLGKKGADINMGSTRVDRGCIQTVVQFQLSIL
jgi:hypothetical protein